MTIRKLDAISALISQGRVRLGMTRAELLTALGPPDEEGGTSRKYRVPALYKYGDVQFVFPGARSVGESESQGLLYAYVDEDVDGIQEPIFVLQQRRESGAPAAANGVEAPGRDEDRVRT